MVVWLAISGNLMGGRTAGIYSDENFNSNSLTSILFFLYSQLVSFLLFLSILPPVVN